jgi:undecaprenyl-diphosphatase
MLEGVIYKESILKVDAWFNNIVFSSWINSVALFITNFGGTVMITILFVLALSVLLYKKRWRYAIISTIALLGAVILQFVIKDLVKRVRPENLIETNFSFPSGHAITAIVFVSLLIYSFKDDFKNKITKYVLIVVFSLFFIAVGLSRIIIHVHWFSDVMAGMSLGLFWFMLLVLIEKAIPGVVPAVKKETKEAKPIVAKEVSKGIIKTAKAIVPALPKK